MALIPIQHERLLKSPAEAEAWFRALGQKRISARGFHTSIPEKFERLVAAIEPKHEHTISFEGGTLDAAAFEALRTLVTARYHYLDVKAAGVNLRVWPELYSWVHASHDRATAAKVLGVPLNPGANTVGDAEINIIEDGRGYPVDVKTKSIAAAFGIFRALAGERMEQGFINGLRAETKPLLQSFLVALGTQVNVVLDIDVSVARTLSELFTVEKHDWQADGLLVYFPEGRIRGFLKMPNIGEKDREKWQARAEKGFRKAGLK